MVPASGLPRLEPLGDGSAIEHLFDEATLVTSSAALYSWSLYYDVDPDGERFLMIQGPEETRGPRINVILNWFEELKQRVPTGR